MRLTCNREENMTAARTIWMVTTAVSLALGCTDSTAPDVALVAIVTPDTMTRTLGGTIAPNVVLRNRTSSTIRVSCGCPTLQMETSAGEWQTVLVGNPDIRYIQNSLVELYDVMGAHTELRRTDGFSPAYVPSIPAAQGRYRLAYSYVVVDAAKNNAPLSAAREVYSNVFVVLP
jgi:hypothetical protein